MSQLVRMPRVRLDSARARTQGMGVIAGQSKCRPSRSMQSRRTVRFTLLLFYSPNERQVARGIRYRERGRRRVDMRPPDKDFEGMSFEQQSRRCDTKEATETAE